MAFSCGPPKSRWPGLGGRLCPLEQGGELAGGLDRIDSTRESPSSSDNTEAGERSQSYI